MKSAIMDKPIDWKKIGTSKPDAQHIAAPQQNTSAVVATPQRPIIPKAKITYPNNKPLAPTVTNIRPVDRQHQNVPNVRNVESPVRNTHSDKPGMEMLDNDFILQVIEDLQGNEPNDLIMRSIGFNEMLRRSLESTIDSNALKIYAIDQASHYGKDIQCHAMQELARRTA